MILLVFFAACSGATGPKPPPDASPPVAADSATDTDRTPGPAQIGVVLNEIVAANDGVALDPDGDADDYVEVYNGGDEAVDVSDWTLALDGDRWGFPEGATVPPRGWLVVWCDGDEDGLHASFSLPKEGAAILLEDDAGVDHDAVTWGPDAALGAAETNVSWARVPDGDGPWLSAPPTAGFANPTR